MARPYNWSFGLWARFLWQTRSFVLLYPEGRICCGLGADVCPYRLLLLLKGCCSHRHAGTWWAQQRDGAINLACGNQTSLMCIPLWDEMIVSLELLLCRLLAGDHSVLSTKLPMHPPHKATGVPVPHVSLYWECTKGAPVGSILCIL